MNLRRIIPTDITASALVHLSLLALLILYSEVHQFGSVATESVPVNIVTPQDIPEQPAIDEKVEPVPEPTPQPDFSLLDKAPVTKAPDSAPQSTPAAKPQKQAPLPKPQATKSTPQPQPQAQPQPQTPPQPQPQAQSQSAAPAYKPPEPDPSIKYHVLLGLPPALAPLSPEASDKGADSFDAPASQSADVASSVVAEFRRHLRTCAKLPAALAPSDDVKVKLRVFMNKDGRLAGEPVLIEASASMKGPLLMKGAISAIEACQPFAMLPADRYGEWKVLDLSFTPKDFSGP